MKVAVITPYYQEPTEMLRQCYDSVRNQTYPATHFMVSDGIRNPEALGWSAEHILLPAAHGDNGNTARCIGSLSAIGRGFDAIAYLDADNWYHRDHIESLVRLHQQTGAVVCTATRNFHRMDGTFMYPDHFGYDAQHHADTSCFFVTKPAFGVLPLWSMMPKPLSPICDRVMWLAILHRGISHSRHPIPTVAFRTRYQVHYQRMAEVPPPGTKTCEESTGPAYRWWETLPPHERDGWKQFMGTPSL